MASQQFPLNRYFHKSAGHKKDGHENDHEEKISDDSKKNLSNLSTVKYSKNDLIELGHSVSSLKQNVPIQAEKVNNPSELKLASPFPQELFAEYTET
ncbi:MAG: hypothetical protein SFU25_10575, partial [Candidatus Caenarcaniphilales bacterium]|nr:hypothetical protein [Candidatus Caenarcaniphilales bacterium]